VKIIPNNVKFGEIFPDDRGDGCVRKSIETHDIACTYVEGNI
jgi:hypothetical protein